MKPTWSDIDDFLNCCMGKNDFEAVKSYLEKYGDAIVNENSYVNSQTALAWTVSYKHPKITELLLEHGADPHIESAHGNSAWKLALQSPRSGAAAVVLSWPEKLKQRELAEEKRMQAEELAAELTDYSTALKEDKPAPPRIQLRPREKTL